MMEVDLRKKQEDQYIEKVYRITKEKNELVWREIFVQRPYELETLYDILTHIAALTSRGPVIWEARCRGGRMHYFLATPQRSTSRVHEAFKAHANVQFAEGVTRAPVSEARKLQITRSSLPLNTEETASMLRATLTAMTGGRSDAETVLQLMLGAAYAPSAVPKNLPDPTTSLMQVIFGPIPNATAEQRRAARGKAEQYSYDAEIRIGMSGDHTGTRINNIVSALRTLENVGVHVHADKDSPASLDKTVMPWRMPLRLSVKEAACFLLLPAGEEELPGTPGLHPKLMLPPKWYRELGDRIFAETLGNDPIHLGISAKDALEHTMLLGPTGAGKSTAMESLILSDIDAGRSVLVIDPKNDLCRELLERIPEKRREDVVILDPSDPCPVGFNPLAYNQDPSLTTDAILAVFQEFFAKN